ncbi:hypothetical protein Mgra_00006230 [Meloidogyne graminicola]|uniref:Uncharacterized protein n=1 Tax=Meloidogyne graminicola TaxID=189291 RepID=A0A8S9ZM64_9BILA|nr:hypothetical protein Mgra_00006230 [Meloidogyne graminicola]
MNLFIIFSTFSTPSFASSIQTQVLLLIFWIQLICVYI